MNISHIKRYRFFKCAVIVVLCVFTFTGIPCVHEGVALSPWASTQKVGFRRQMQHLALKESGRLIYAETEEQKELLRRNNNARALLLSHGKILASSDLKKNDLILLRTIIHEQIEAVMQILHDKERNRYLGIKELVLPYRSIRDAYSKLFTNGKMPDLPPDLILNDIISTAFELLILRENGLMKEEEMSGAENEFYNIIKPLIEANRHNYFNGLFWDGRIRELYIRVELANGYVFKQVPAQKKINPPDEVDQRLLPEVMNTFRVYKNYFRHCEPFKAHYIARKEFGIVMDGLRDEAYASTANMQDVRQFLIEELELDRQALVIELQRISEKIPLTRPGIEKGELSELYGRIGKMISFMEKLLAMFRAGKGTMGHLLSSQKLFAEGFYALPATSVDFTRSVDATAPDADGPPPAGWGPGTPHISQPPDSEIGAGEDSKFDPEYILEAGRQCLVDGEYWVGNEFVRFARALKFIEVQLGRSVFDNGIRTEEAVSIIRKAKKSSYSKQEIRFISRQIDKCFRMLKGGRTPEEIVSSLKDDYRNIFKGPNMIESAIGRLSDFVTGTHHAEISGLLSRVKAPKFFAFDLDLTLTKADIENFNQLIGLLGEDPTSFKGIVTHRTVYFDSEEEKDKKILTVYDDHFRPQIEKVGIDPRSLDFFLGLAVTPATGDAQGILSNPYSSLNYTWYLRTTDSQGMVREYAIPVESSYNGINKFKAMSCLQDHFRDVFIRDNGFSDEKAAELSRRFLHRSILVLADDDPDHAHLPLNASPATESQIPVIGTYGTSSHYSGISDLFRLARVVIDTHQDKKEAKDHSEDLVFMFERDVLSGLKSVLKDPRYGVHTVTSVVKAHKSHVNGWNSKETPPGWGPGTPHITQPPDDPSRGISYEDRRKIVTDHMMDNNESMSDPSEEFTAFLERYSVKIAVKKRGRNRTYELADARAPKKSRKTVKREPEEKTKPKKDSSAAQAQKILKKIKDLKAAAGLAMSRKMYEKAIELNEEIVSIAEKATEGTADPSLVSRLNNIISFHSKKAQRARELLPKEEQRTKEKERSEWKDALKETERQQAQKADEERKQQAAIEAEKKKKEAEAERAAKEEERRRQKRRQAEEAKKKKEKDREERLERQKRKELERLITRDPEELFKRIRSARSKIQQNIELAPGETAEVIQASFEAIKRSLMDALSRHDRFRKTDEKVLTQMQQVQKEMRQLEEESSAPKGSFKHVNYPSVSALMSKAEIWMNEETIKQDFRQGLAPADPELLDKTGVEPGDSVYFYASWAGDWASSFADALGKDKVKATDASEPAVEALKERFGSSLNAETANAILSPEPEEAIIYDWTFSFEPFPIAPDALAVVLMRGMLSGKGTKLVYRFARSKVIGSSKTLMDGLADIYGTSASSEKRDIRGDSLGAKRDTKTVKCSILTLTTSDNARTLVEQDLAVLTALDDPDVKTLTGIKQHAAVKPLGLSSAQVMTSLERITLIFHQIRDALNENAGRSVADEPPFLAESLKAKKITYLPGDVYGVGAARRNDPSFSEFFRDRDRKRRQKETVESIHRCNIINDREHLESITIPYLEKLCGDHDHRIREAAIKTLEKTRKRLSDMDERENTPQSQTEKIVTFLLDTIRDILDNEIYGMVAEDTQLAIEKIEHLKYRLARFYAKYDIPSHPRLLQQASALKSELDEIAIIATNILNNGTASPPSNPSDNKDLQTKPEENRFQHIVLEAAEEQRQPEVYRIEDVCERSYSSSGELANPSMGIFVPTPSYIALQVIHLMKEMNPGASICDLGHGNGRFCFLASRHFRDVSGYEWQKPLYDVSQEHLSDLKGEGITGEVSLNFGNFLYDDVDLSKYDILYFFFSNPDNYTPKQWGKLIRDKMVGPKGLHPGAKLIVFGGLDPISNDETLKCEKISIDGGFVHVYTRGERRDDKDPDERIFAGPVDPGSFVVDILKNNGYTDLNGKKVLEIGFGPHAHNFKRLLDEGATVSAFDKNLEYIMKARARFPGIEIRNGDFTKKVDYEDNSFDAVIFANILDYALGVEDRTALFKEVFRVMKPGATLVYTDVADYEDPITAKGESANTNFRKMLEQFNRSMDAGEIAKSAGFEILARNRKVGVGILRKPAPEEPRIRAAALLKDAIFRLWQAASNEYRAIALELEMILSRTKKEGQSLILYADDVLLSTAAVDLDNTIRNILRRHSVLNGGKIVLFARQEAYATKLEEMIKDADPSIDVITVTEKELRESRNTGGTESGEVEALVKFARSKGAREILALIKGAAADYLEKDEPEVLEELCRELEVPVVVIDPQKGLYSFAEALLKALAAKKWGAAKSWLIILPPIRTLTDDIKARHDRYLAELRAEVSA